MGMTYYCSRFIPNYATKTEPLRRLTHKDQPWEWTPQHDRAVNELKSALVKAPVTGYFDPTKMNVECRINKNILKFKYFNPRGVRILRRIKKGLHTKIKALKATPSC